MMKVGCNSLSVPDMDVFTFLEQAYAWRLDTVDIHRRVLDSADPAYLLDVKHRLLEYGLPLGYIGVSGGFVGDEDHLAEQVATHKEAIDVAQFLGSPIIRCFGGSLPDEDTDPAPYWDPMIECMREVSEYGAQNGVMVGLQNHDNNNMASTADAVIDIIDDVDHPNFTHILDTGQWEGSIGASPRGEYDPDVDIYEHIARTAPYAWYVRTKFYQNASGEEAWIDYDRVFEILADVGFNGYLSIVYEGEDDRVASVGMAVDELRRHTETHER